LLIASHLGHRSSIARSLEVLDALAAGVAGRDLDAVAAHLFGTLGFAGNRDDYYDAANSLLPEVLRRRVGIPITLSVVVIEVARRCGVRATGVGMPGHFLVGDGDDPERWLDAFDGGTWLDVAGARDRFALVHGSADGFDRRHLDPTPDLAILARVLGNLLAIHRREGDVNKVLRTLELRDVIPGAATSPRAEAELAEALVSVGRVADAAERYDRLADRLGGDRSAPAVDRARALRARLN
jgi:regulator of sirC expression with transglutaminase-like and TPR domain